MHASATASTTSHACAKRKSPRKNHSLTIHLPAELERFVHDQVLAGRYRSEDNVIHDALEQLRTHATTPTTAPR